MAGSSQFKMEIDKQSSSATLPTQCYERHTILEAEEDLKHEFKAHRQLSDGDLSYLAMTKGRNGELNIEKAQKRRKSLSPYICGMLNTGLGGIMYLGVTDGGMVEGIMLSTFQKDHFKLALKDLLSRYNPKVPKHMVRVVFVPVVDPDTTESEFKVERFGYEGLSTLDHELRFARYCWCDNYTMASLERGHMHRFYVIELHFETWAPKDERNSQLLLNGDDTSRPLFENEDGKVFMRGNGITAKLSDKQVIQFAQISRKQASQSENGYLDNNCEVSKRLTSCAIPSSKAHYVKRIQGGNCFAVKCTRVQLDDDVGSETSSSMTDNEEIFFSFSEDEEDDPGENTKM